MTQTKTKRTGRKAPFCGHCDSLTLPTDQSWTDHKFTDKCLSWCSYCDRNGHHMSLCHSLKHCWLCGKTGHNPYRCWTYSTITQWIARARVLGRCVSCLRPWKPSPFKIGWNRGKNMPTDHIRCNTCGGKNANDYFPPQGPEHTKESQTEVNSYILQESQSTALTHREKLFNFSDRTGNGA